MPLYRTPLISKDQPIIDLKNGCATPYFQTVMLSVSGFADAGAAAMPDVTQLTADVATLNGQMSALTLVVAGKAPIASPTFTGNPLAPTQTQGNNSTRLATTAFVHTEAVARATFNAWAAATGTAERTTFATYTAPTISNPPTQVEVQAIADHLQILSRRMMALIDDLKT